jgi:hypothetical protein
VLLGRNRARPRCTMRGAARGHAGRGPTRPRSARRAAHGGAARQAGDDTASVRGKRLRSSGSPARERWMAVRRRRASFGRDSGGVGEAVGTAARSARRRSGRRRRGCRVGAARSRLLSEGERCERGGRARRDVVGRWAAQERRALSATAAARKAGRAVCGREVCYRDARRAVPTAP